MLHSVRKLAEVVVVESHFCRPPSQHLLSVLWIVVLVVIFFLLFFLPLLLSNLFSSCQFGLETQASHIWAQWINFCVCCLAYVLIGFSSQLGKTIDLEVWKSVEPPLPFLFYHPAARVGERSWCSLPPWWAPDLAGKSPFKGASKQAQLCV